MNVFFKNSMLWILLIFGFSATAQTLVPGYVKKNGTYVAPYYKTEPNKTKLDNYSTKGNVNPFTGKAGTKDPNQDPVVAPVHPTNTTTQVYPSSQPSESAQATQCLGITRKGNQCLRMTKSLSGYCWQH